MNSRRVVVTGIGAVSSIGNSVDAMWESLLAGKSGIGPVTKFDASAYRTRIAGEVRDLDVSKYMTEKEARRLDDFCLYAIAAGDEAMKDAGLGIDLRDGSLADPNRVGVCVGSGIGGMRTMEEQCMKRSGPGAARTRPGPHLSVPDSDDDYRYGLRVAFHALRSQRTESCGGFRLLDGKSLHRRILLDGEARRCGYYDYRRSGGVRVQTRICRILLDEGAEPEK